MSEIWWPRSVKILTQLSTYKMFVTRPGITTTNLVSTCQFTLRNSGCSLNLGDQEFLQIKSQVSTTSKFRYNELPILAETGPYNKNLFENSDIWFRLPLFSAVHFFFRFWVSDLSVCGTKMMTSWKARLQHKNEISKS